MSERGSFVTQYIYCPKCLEAVRAVLEKDDKFLRGVLVPTWTGDTTSPEGKLPIVAGKIGGLSPGEEIWDFELHDGPEIAAAVCHPVRVAVLGDTGSEVFVLGPEGKVVRLIDPGPGP